MTYPSAAAAFIPYRIADPLLFYSNVCGNFEQQYDREQIESQLKTEFISALQPAFASISQQGIRPSALPAHALELCDAMNQALTQKWSQLRGLVIVSVAMNPITLPEEDAKMIKEAQRMAMLRNPSMAAATLAGAQADAMKTAAGNCCRRYGRLYGYEYGKYGRWIQRPDTLYHGTAAGSHTATDAADTRSAVWYPTGTACR